MNVGDVCHKNPVTVRPFDEITVAAQLMREKHVGYIVVAEPGTREADLRPLGVLTDRDIVITVVAREADPNFLRVNDVMTRSPVVALADESLGSALGKMRRIGVRRLPVIGEREELVGVLSLDDIIDQLVGELQSVAGSIRTGRAIEQTLRP
jgi:CBS domain-containing protein